MKKGCKGKSMKNYSEWRVFDRLVLISPGWKTKEINADATEN